MDDVKLETNVEDEDKINLMSANDFLIFPPDRSGNVNIWVNCKKEMNVRISFYDLKNSVKSLFGSKIDAVDFIYLIQRGSIIYTDKKVYGIINPKPMGMENPIPTLNAMKKALGIR